MIYIGLLLLSFSLTYFIKNYAVKKSLIAEVNERSSHSVPTPHGGGIAIALTWGVGLIYLWLHNDIDNHLFYALSVGFIISIVSFLDDLYDLNPKIRLIAQAIVAGLGLYAIGGLDQINFVVYSISNPFFANAFAFLLIVWYINLYNFLDGINGYAGAEAVFLAIAGFLFFGGEHFIVLAMSVLGFLFWNWNKAKIFMGDVGSTLLGYNVAIFTLYYSNIEAKSLWIWIILFAPYWFDATVTLIRRKINGEKLSQAHKKHGYQRLTQAGWSHYKVTNSLILLNITIFAFVYYISNTAIVFFVVMALLCGIMYFVETKKRFE